MPFDLDDFDGIIRIGGTQVANRPRYIEYELAYSDRRGQGLGRNQNLTRQQSLQKASTEIGFAHVADLAQHSFAFGLSRFHHHERDSSPIRPMAALAEKHSPQFRARKVVNRIRL